MLISGLGVVDMVRGYSRRQPRPGGMDYAENGQGKSGDSSGNGDAIHGGQKMIRSASLCDLLLVLAQWEGPGRAGGVVRTMDFRGC